MILVRFIKEHLALLAVILFWVASSVYGGPLLLLTMPLAVFYLWRRDLWADMLFGFLITLVLSDMTPDIYSMRPVKVAKNTYILALSAILLLEQQRLQPMANIFKVFLPLFVYSCFPLLDAGNVVVGLQKTLSYMLLFLAVPNYVLYNYRRQGWAFFRNLILFLLCVLLFQRLFQPIMPHWAMTLNGRFRGFFGNPNGLAMFCYLYFVLFSVVIHVKKDLFSFTWKAIIYATIIYFLLQSGSRSSLMSVLIFVVFSRFFSLSPFLGFIVFFSMMAVTEVITANLPLIVTSLGLESYFRLQTLTDGSGRYFAWQFAWNKINELGYFLFGGGFGNDEYVMRQNYAYLRSMGHHGGVHNSYLTLWFDLGIVGLIIYFRSFILIFVKASKRVPIAFAVMFSVLFSITYESWLAGSLNPFTIMLLIMLTIFTEEEISDPGPGLDMPEPESLPEPEVEEPMFVPPAR